MSRLRSFLNKAAHWRVRDRFDSALEEELRLHLEERADELMASGMSSPDAEAQARRELGSTARIAEDSREAWRWTWLEDLARDLRYAARSLARDRTFVLTAVGSLALGIGVNTTIFSVTAEFLFSEPSVWKPETLASVRLGTSDAVPAREFRFVRDAGVFAGVAGMNPMQEVNWRTEASTARLFVSRVSDNYFAVTGTPVSMGRALGPGERDSAVITHRFWQRLGRDAGVLGRTLVLDGRPYTIVGVLPRVHRSLVGFGYAPDAYLPVPADRGSFLMYARLADGDSRSAGAARLKPVAADLDRIYPDGENRRASRVALHSLTGIERLNQGFLTTISAFFGLLMAVAALLLMIACANVASLLLARGSARSHELSVRLSIGASRGRLVRQLLAESLVLALLGTVAGLLLNVGLTRLLNRVQVAAPFPLEMHMEPDVRLLLYAACIAVAAALVAGLAPALQGTRTGPGSSLKSGASHVVGRGAWRMRNVLITGQISVSVVVLVLAALSLRNLLEASKLDPGFDLDRTIWAQMRLVPESYPGPERVRATVSAALDRLRAAPGVEAAAVASFVPLNDHFLSRSLEVYTDHHPQGRRIEHSWNAVGPDYLKTMGIGLTAGREFDWSDRQGAVRSIIVNDAFARAAFGGENPVGQRVRFSRDAGSERSVIGVARNSKYSTVGEKDRPAVYESFYQAGGGRTALNFLVRVSGPPAASLKAVDQALLSLDGSAACESKPMTNATAFALMPSRIGAGMLGSFGLLGLVLAAAGLYGVIAYSVGRRTREIGLRMALGAQRPRLVALVMREGAWVLGAGMAVGGVAALLVTRPLVRFLVPSVKPADPAAYAAVALALLIAGLAASLRPAVRAIRIDPMTALREE